MCELLSLIRLISSLRINIMTKPNCYDCKFRRSVPGDAHSRCGHPKATSHNSFDNILALMLSMAKAGQPIENKGLKVKGNEHGIRNGWFAWPFNFDPAWLEECNGFENKKEDQKPDDDAVYIPEQGD